MKRAFAFILIFLLLSLCACGGRREDDEVELGVDPSTSPEAVDEDVSEHNPNPVEIVLGETIEKENYEFYLKIIQPFPKYNQFHITFVVHNTSKDDIRAKGLIRCIIDYNNGYQFESKFSTLMGVDPNRKTDSGQWYHYSQENSESSAVIKQLEYAEYIVDVKAVPEVFTSTNPIVLYIYCEDGSQYYFKIPDDVLPLNDYFS